MNIESWFPLGKEITLKGKITDQKQIERLVATLNREDKEMVDNCGFNLESFSFQDSNRDNVVNAIITRTMIAGFLNSGDYDLLNALMFKASQVIETTLPTVEVATIASVKDLLESTGKFNEVEIENMAKELVLKNG